MMGVFALDALLCAIQKGLLPDSFTNTSTPNLMKALNWLDICKQEFIEPSFLHKMHSFHLDSVLGCSLFTFDGRNILPTHNCTSSILNDHFFALLYSSIFPIEQLFLHKSINYHTRLAKEEWPYATIAPLIKKSSFLCHTKETFNTLSYLYTTHPYAAHIFVAGIELARLSKSHNPKENQWLDAFQTNPENQKPAMFVFYLIDHSLQCGSIDIAFKHPYFMRLFQSEVPQKSVNPYPSVKVLKNALHSGGLLGRYPRKIMQLKRKSFQSVTFEMHPAPVEARPPHGYLSQFGP